MSELCSRRVRCVRNRYKNVIFGPSDSPGHIVGHYLNQCPKRPKIGRRTASDTVSELCSNTVRFSLNGCPKFGNRTTGEQSQTRCRTLPRHVSETSGNRQADSTGHVVGHNLNRCPKRPKIGSRTVAGHYVGVMLKTCPMCPESLQKCNFCQSARCRTPCRT